jgi:hypothetical protein
MKIRKCEDALLTLFINCIIVPITELFSNLPVGTA